ncbi:peptidoglycan editing factor PgeF [Capilliphycus salinus ALCB114379]|uniref:peptidoglycan editing factor PgeF n=1 Tax=Capilliphycus salinus TaxID=2768948 RepID=UPI0039A4FE77
MYSWYWHQWQDLPYLKCSLLDSWPHGFFSRHFNPRPPESLVAVLEPDAAAYRVKQVHGNLVLNTANISPLPSTDSTDSPELLEADAIFAQHPKQAVWVASADCVPVLIADTETKNVAAIHAGWRGTALKILPQAIAQFQAAGSELINLRIALGPAISGDVYQVSSDVALQLGATILPIEATTGVEEALAALFDLAESPVKPDPEPDKVRVDVRRVNALQLEQLGISSEQVAISPHCTYQQPESFFSYRRDHLKNVQWSGIVSVES